ncbi:protein RETICULATA-RELATED 1, chloroplastic-like [Rutidosis leptorrhynchoides]|uniref:protein RETICULATA-RELATED 1, chloroplastic-like n=1 Tax=Rutidosis leptorrhynchoides TaxID=125765 RepID=UPI003A993296
MALPPPGIAVMKLNCTSRRHECPRQFLIKFKPVSEYKVSIFITKPISSKFNLSRSLYVSKLNCAKSDSLGNMAIVTEVFDEMPDRDDDENDDDDGNGKFPPPGNGGGGGGGDSGGGGGGGEDDDHEEKEFGPLLMYEEVMKVAKSHGVNSLPDDMLKAAEATGLRKLILTRYLELQGSGWIMGFLTKNFAMFRNRMLADPSFLFKVGTEIVIDSACATFAEVQKRGKDFWDEFELYAADLLVGIVVDIALVGMLAPYARIGKRPVASGGLFSGLKNSVSALPSSVFEFERPGSRFSAQQRLASYFYKGLLYGSVGFGCGLIGQGIANMIMNAKRRMHTSECDVRVPPLVQSAVLWGVFLAVSSNTRYQVINGLESVVEASPLAKQVPLVAMAFTVGVRFANNIYGGMQFVDWARWSGVQ